MVCCADSPPTMDDIAKEIYRFRKKFNIQPNSATTTLTRSVSTTPTRTGGFIGTGSLRRSNHQQASPSPSYSTNWSMPRSSSSTGHYPISPQSTAVTSTLPRNPQATSPITKSTIPEGFPKLSVEPTRSPPTYTGINSPPTYAIPIPPAQRTVCSTLLSAPSPVVPPSPMLYPNYGWIPTPPPKCSTPIVGNQPTPPSYITTPPPKKSLIPPVPPTRVFGSSRKIYPMRPNGFIGGVSTPTSAHSSLINNNNNIYASSPPGRYPSATPPHSNGHYDLPGYPDNNNHANNGNVRKSISLLPSMPFRRNSVAFAETSNSYSPSMKPRTSLGEFKRLLQASQKKRSSISAVEALKPKGLETTL